MMFFDLYYIDMKYVRELRKVHEHIYSVSPQSGKQNRPFLGVITLVNGKEYCVPLTSPKSKHLGKVGSDRIKVVDMHQKDSNGAFKVIGVLDFGGMIPVTGKVISKIDLKIYPSPAETAKPEKKSTKKKTARKKTAAKTTDTPAPKKTGGRKKKSDTPAVTGESQTSRL